MKCFKFNFCIPSIIFYTIYAFFVPHAIKIILLAFKIVLIPIVIALLGTLSNPPNDEAASILVMGSKVLVLSIYILIKFNNFAIINYKFKFFYLNGYKI